ncbi:MAG: hypothetical protein ABI547_03860, partial [Betaproteobacteria bacterium]
MIATITQWRASCFDRFDERDRDCARLILAIAVFLVLAALSLVNRGASVILCTAYAAAMPVIAPRIGWGLLLFIVPFQYFLHLENEHFATFIAVSMLSLSMRSAYMMFKTGKPPAGGFGVILLLFIVLVAAHLSFVEFMHDAKALVFLITLFFVYTTARECGSDTAGRRLAQMAMVMSAGTMAVASFLALYVPIPELIGATDEVSSLRLQGVQSNPNSFALFLMPAVLLMVSSLLTRTSARQSWRTLAALMVALMMLAATGTKSVSLGTVGAIFIVTFFTDRATFAAPRFWGGLAAGGFVVALWILWIGPVVQYEAAQEWRSVPHSELM